MSTKTKNALSEQEIDQIVVAQAGDDSAWKKRFVSGEASRLPCSITGRPCGAGSVSGPVAPDRKREDWLTDVIRERVGAGRSSVYRG